ELAVRGLLQRGLVALDAGAWAGQRGLLAFLASSLAALALATPGWAGAAGAVLPALALAPTGRLPAARLARALVLAALAACADAERAEVGAAAAEAELVLQIAVAAAAAGAEPAGKIDEAGAAPRPRRARHRQRATVLAERALVVGAAGRQAEGRAPGFHGRQR